LSCGVNQRGERNSVCGLHLQLAVVTGEKQRFHSGRELVLKLVTILVFHVPGTNLQERERERAAGIGWVASSRVFRFTPSTKNDSYRQLSMVIFAAGYPTSVLFFSSSYSHTLSVLSGYHLRRPFMVLRATEEMQTPAFIFRETYCDPDEQELDKSL